MENKKNTILLTVIAVATLLVAVVGATFAYFTAQGGAASSAKVTVSTGTAGSSSLGTFTAISIYADANSFAQGKGNATGTSTGTVAWTAPGVAVDGSGDVPSEDDRSFCYTASLAVTKNDFVYSSTNPDHNAELTLTAKKNDVVVLQDKDITVGTASVSIPTEKDGSTMTHKLVAEAGATKSDKWELTVTLVNLGVDQNDNTSKQFNGAVKFDKTNCQ